MCKISEAKTLTLPQKRPTCTVVKQQDIILYVSHCSRTQKVLRTGVVLFVSIQIFTPMLFKLGVISLYLYSNVQYLYSNSIF